MQTRKQLVAENLRLKAQLEVHGHETRKSLNQRVVTLKERVTMLEREVATRDAALEKALALVKEIKAEAEAMKEKSDA